MKRLTLFFLCLCIGIGWAVAQNRTVKGTVISSVDNLPVIGANVVVVGQETIGTTTDIDGNFDLSVPANAKQLQFSYTGLATIKEDIKPVMKVTMGVDAKQLDVVVVLGYGSGQKLSTVSGSVARVGGEKLQEKPVANVMDALQGQVAGMQVQTGSGDPNAVASVQIHGTGSLGASSSPLYIVDGVQTDPSAIAAMNSNDIESMVVLKDASSTAIYGARAANGVIYITTKRGKIGEAARITANAQFGISQLISRGYASQMMDTEQLLAYQSKHAPAGWPVKPGDVDGLVDLLTNSKYPFQLSFDRRGFDWMNYLMGRNAPTIQGDVQIAGASDRSSYFISGGYFDQTGITREVSRFTKYNGRVNLDSRVKDWFRVGLNLTGAYTKAITSGFEGNAYWNTGTFGALALPPYITPMTADGKVTEGFIKTMYGRTASRDMINRYQPNYSNSYMFTGNAYGQLNPLKGLTFKTLVGVDLDISRGTAMNLPSYPLSADGLGARRETYSRDAKFTVTNTGEYKWNINDKNNMTFLLGQEFISASGEAFQALGLGFEDDNFMALNQAQLGTFLRRPASSAAAYAFNSFFGRLNYDYDRFWYLDLSARNDASSRFGRNKRSGWFYSVGTMFDLHRKFMPENEKVSTLQVKASYGTTGNSEISNYGHMALIGSGNYDTGLATYLASMGNPDLSWETQAKLNVGLVLGFFQERLNLDASFYMRDTKDMLMNVPLPYTTGFGNRWANVGSLRNMGVDVTLNADLVRTKDWNVHFMTTFNYNKQTILSLFNDLQEYSIPNTNTIYRVGHPNVFYLAKFAGVDPKDGTQKWYDPATGGTTKDYYDQALQQPSDKAVTPPIAGGFSLGVDWIKAGLSLQADFSYVVGKWTMNNDRFFFENNTSGFMWLNRSKVLLDEWTKEGQQTNIPAFDQELQFDDRLLEDASFLRMKYLQLGYSIPKSVFSEKTILSGARVYVSARNLFTITKFSGMDPETSGNMSMNQYPNTRQFMAGVQLQF